MIGQQFAVAKRLVAMFCVALCMALSVQMTIVVLDRLKHVFQVAHAPNGLAGPVFDHGHHLRVDVQQLPVHAHDLASPHGHEIAFVPHVAHGHDDDMVLAHSHETPDMAHAHEGHAGLAVGLHTHDGLPQGHDHGPITHHHHGSGMLTPWLVSASVEVPVIAVKALVSGSGAVGHPDAPALRQDRPPKLNLERAI